jgi:hypothetical protein
MVEFIRTVLMWIKILQYIPLTNGPKVEMIDINIGAGQILPRLMI